MSLLDVQKRANHKVFGLPGTVRSLGKRVTRLSVGRGIHVGYTPNMPTGRIDRKAWADEVAAFIRRFDPGSRDPGNKSAFARRVGVTTKTIDRWLACQNDVSYESVSQIVQRLNIPDREQMELLHRVGYYSGLGAGLAALIPSAPPLIPQDPHEDPVIRQIMDDPRLSEAERLELVQEQVAIMDADRQRRMDDYERLMRRLDSRRDVP